MRNINEPGGSSTHRSIGGGEIDSSVDARHGFIGLRDRVGGEHLPPVSTSEHANDDASVDADVDARDDVVADADDEKPFGGLTPSEAAQRRWARGGEQAPPPDSDAAIVSALRRKAGKGDVNAARELREWRVVEGHLIEGEGWLELLTVEEREDVRALIQRALARATSGRSG